MALSEAAKMWFLCIVEVHLHEELEKVPMKIDLEEITEDAIQALIGLPEGGLFSIETLSIVTLTKFFGKYSIANIAYRTQGGEDALFWEVA